MLSRFLTSRQEKEKLPNYVQDLTTCLADMQLNALPKAVQVIIFIEVLRTEVARTEVLCIHPSTFKKAVDVALNDKFNFKAARYGTQFRLIRLSL